VIGAAIALVMRYALAEMAVVHPLAGSFGLCAERYHRPGSASSSGPPTASFRFSRSAPK
jgi:amino acid permease